MTADPAYIYKKKADHAPELLYPRGTVTNRTVTDAASMCGTPFYLYDGSLIADQCRSLLHMPRAHGLSVRYAIKANPSRAVLELIAAQGMQFEAGSMNEVKRAQLAGIHPGKILLTSQDVPDKQNLLLLKQLMHRGLNYTICSFLQLQRIAPYAGQNGIPLCIRIHPGQGSGASATRNTGDAYASFGVQQGELPLVLRFAREQGIEFSRLHVHIGSGSEPALWKENVLRTLHTVEEAFPHVTTINLGGGFKVARMPDEDGADINELGEFTAEKLRDFSRQTGRKLHLEIEPGTFVVANSGYLVTSVIDIKPNRDNEFMFYLLNGGMESNPRPLMYGARHPFYMVSKSGKLLWSDFKAGQPDCPGVIVGRCCETGDSQCLDPRGIVTPRPMARPGLGDMIVIGGTGAYCSSMAPFNYNSYLQAAECMLVPGQGLRLIREAQSLEQLVNNEKGLAGTGRQV